MELLDKLLGRDEGVRYDPEKHELVLTVRADGVSQEKAEEFMRQIDQMNVMEFAVAGFDESGETRTAGLRGLGALSPDLPEEGEP